MIQTVNDALVQTRNRLHDEGIEGAQGDARRLVAHWLGLNPSRLTLHLRDEIGAHNFAMLDAMITRRAEKREPMSHILGHRLFYGRDFLVTADVLDPRPETEELIQAALDHGFSNFLDLGTGSGCIAVTLLTERPAARGLASDLSPDALNVAAQNAVAHNVADRLTLVASDWFAVIAPQRFDLIVSNPPYIALDEMASLSPEVHHEPHMALTDGADGLGAYRKIISQAGAYLAKDGALMFEIGPTQAVAVAALCTESGFSQIAIRPDMDGRDRVVVAKR